MNQADVAPGGTPVAAPVGTAVLEFEPGEMQLDETVPEPAATSMQVGVCPRNYPNSVPKTDALTRRPK